MLHFHVLAQGTFQNLDFESAVIVPVPGDVYGRVQFAAAYPGWTGFSGTNPQTLALYNKMFLDSTGLGLQGPGSGLTIDGNYTAMIQSGFALFGYPNQEDGSLSQTGAVPADARSIQFEARTGGSFQVTLGGQALALTPLLATSTYTLYGADVTSFSGSLAELRFTASRCPPPRLPMNTLFLDDIVFSAEVIPEPDTLALLALGVLILVHRLSPLRREPTLTDSGQP
jgi:hypothetical protein